MQDIKYARKQKEHEEPENDPMNPRFLLALTTTSVYLVGRIVYGLLWDRDTEKNGLDELFGIIWLGLVGWRVVARWVLRG